MHMYTHSMSLSPDNVCMTSPLAASHILMVLSLDPDITVVPSADMATELIQSL